jgi:hypothetical protein
MALQFLVPEITVREVGTGPVLDLGNEERGVLTLTLGLTRIIEQESIDVSVWGSADGTDWGTAPVATFPQKFYCGSYQLLLDLSERPEIRYLRAKWQVNRWGKGDSKPLFGVYLFAEELQPRVAMAGV